MSIRSRVLPWDRGLNLNLLRFSFSSSYFNDLVIKGGQEDGAGEAFLIKQWVRICNNFWKVILLIVLLASWKHIWEDLNFFVYLICNSKSNKDLQTPMHGSSYKWHYSHRGFFSFSLNFKRRDFPTENCVGLQKTWDVCASLKLCVI